MGFIYILTHLFSFSSSLPFASCQSYYITLISGQAPGNLHPAQIKEHQGENVIYIDMADLNKHWDNHSGSFVVEMLN